MANPAQDQQAPVEVVRHEERLQVGTEVRVSGRAVLRKYVVTETVTQTFEVRHEEVRLEQEVADEGNWTAGAAPTVDHEPVEVVLHREVPVVTMRVEPVERVRLVVDSVTDQLQVGGELRREQVVLDQAGTQPTR